MIQKKICMLGAHGVGKTSLVRQFVHSIFSEKYHSTIGVKIDTREAEVEGKMVKLLLWDVAGEEENFRIPPSYMVGSAGSLLVIDGTRPWTVEAALDIDERLRETVGEVPLVLVLNKVDLIDEWEIDEESLNAFREKSFPIVRSSAKTGEGVEEAFAKLTRAILGM
jgi:small GTP-binding protein